MSAACALERTGRVAAALRHVLEVWRPWACEVTGRGLQASHFLVEDRPEDVADELAAFLE